MKQHDNRALAFAIPLTDDSIVTQEHTRQKAVPPGTSVRTLRVRVTDGVDAGLDADCKPGHSITVGSARDNTLVLSDPTISRYHLELKAQPEGILVVDLGSLNGSRIGDIQIERAIVPTNAVIEIGQSRVTVGDGETVQTDPPSCVTVPGLVAVSDSMCRVSNDIATLAKASISVLVQGETGTGKEVVAQAIHKMSPRCNKPFIVVDCGSMPATLIASELFGHERGAFTGAERRHQGAFERAHGGTIFLDEIGELPLQVQATLLGALERRRFRRVGGETEIEVDVRVVAATHRDLRAQVNTDEFRADLYYRLAVARIAIPPLRERPEDIDALVRHFVPMITGGDGEFPFGAATMEALKRHRWSGNVRELRNVIEAALAMGKVKLEVTVPGSVASDGKPRGLRPYKEARAEIVEGFEATYLADLMEQCDGNASEAARRARMNRPYLLSLLKRHGLR